MPVALEADRQGATPPTPRASTIDAWMNSGRGFTVSSAVLAVAARQGRLGGNLLWGSWTLGAWELHPLSLLLVASGTLIISKTLRIPKL